MIRGWLTSLALVVALVAVAIGWASDHQRAQADAALEGEQASRAQLALHYHTLAARVDTVLDTVRVRLAAVPTVDTLVLDSLVHDTTWVRQYVATSQPALAACHALAVDCTAFRRIADSTRRTDSVRIGRLEARRTGASWKERGAWTIVGALLGQASCRPRE